MKGVVFNLLEEAVTRGFGEDAWEDLIEASGVSGAYTSLGNYSDDEIERLVAAASAKLGMEPNAVLEWFGRAAMPLLKERYAVLFEGHASSRTFILSVNSIIHPEVRKIYAGAACPFFHMAEEPGGGIAMRYSSSRRMFALAVGFVRGAADLWGDDLAVSTPADRPDTLIMAWAP